MYRLVVLTVLGARAAGRQRQHSVRQRQLFAGQGPGPERFVPAQRDAIVSALGDGKTYSEISANDRQKVTASLGRISSLLGGAGSVDQLAEATKVEVFNEQELINTVLT
ncbi:hypothetical protein H1235_14370 [Pseudoxanthomonas sp. NC8]|nr:hypothetical protein H1235_14370 [Pseudoxanthomonas sp. NC8]